MQIPMLDLLAEYRYMKADIDEAISRCLGHQKWVLGPEVKELEQTIAAYLGVQHCIGCSSGTDALVLSLRALAIKTKGREYFDRSDEIITTPFTFTATGDAILRSGATPVFVDIDPSSYNISSDGIRKYIAGSSGRQVVGILPVHLYGQSCDMHAIQDIAREHGLFVVEDVAQAFGGMWKERKLGSAGDAGAFSFFPSKNLGGFGDGGMVSTGDDETAEMVRMLLKHGGRDKYNVDHIGYNARLDTLQAAILLAKFRYIDEFNERRRKIADLYHEGLNGLDGLVLPMTDNPSPISGLYHVFHQYTIRVLNGRRDALQRHLGEKGISTMVYYPFPLHKMKVFGEGRARVHGSLTEAEKACEEVLSLPMEPLMGVEQVQQIMSEIKQWITLSGSA